MPPQYTQKYRKEWEKLEATKEWLNPCISNSSKAYCKYCKVLLNAKLGGLIKHGQTLKHVTASKPFSSKRQQVIPFQLIDTCTKEQRKEAQLSLSMSPYIRQSQVSII